MSADTIFSVKTNLIPILLCFQIGDIPDAELKPPENVLFICKLNPVTTAEDLEIIFSRFGKTLRYEEIHFSF